MHVPAYTQLRKLFFVIVLQFVYSCIYAFVLVFGFCSRNLSTSCLPSLISAVQSVMKFGHLRLPGQQLHVHSISLLCIFIRLIIIFKFITEVAKLVTAFARSLRFTSKKFSGYITLRRWWLKWLIELALCQLTIYTLMLKHLLTFWLSFN